MSDQRDPHERPDRQPADATDQGEQPTSADDATNTLDDVFGADAFREYPEEPILPRLPLREQATPSAERAPGGAAPAAVEPAEPAEPASPASPAPDAERSPTAFDAPAPTRPVDAAPSAPEPPRPPVYGNAMGPGEPTAPMQESAPQGVGSRGAEPGNAEASPSAQQSATQPAEEANRLPFGEPLVPSAPVAPDDEPRRSLGRRLLPSAPAEPTEAPTRRSTWAAPAAGAGAAPDVIGAISGNGTDEAATGGAGLRAGARTGGGGIPKRQKVLLWIAGSLVAVLALLALFLLGTRLGAAQEERTAEPTATPTQTEEPVEEPEPSAPVVGPVAPGTYAWDGLGGGECIEPYTNPWAEEFTVVDCATPHSAQLTVKQPFPEYDESTPFPGVEALQVQLAALCSAPGAILLDVAGQYSDIQVDGSFAATEEQWDAGLRDYSCFVSRSSGEPIEGSLIP